jgi:tRNA-dihydrouridine synthase A
MMDWTDRYCRYFHRLLSPHALLYTEMVVAKAVLFGDRARLLAFHPAERPVALQLGGSDPRELAQAARIGADSGFDEINLNVGCPSDRVQSGRFGACLMAEPALVAECVAAMREAIGVPVTVKSRTGIDEHDDYAFLARFVAAITEAGCERLVLHARKAILAGLSPRQNREVPPLRYDLAARVKQDFPRLEVILNGGLRTLEAASAQLKVFDGVMIGREAYKNPYFLARLERRLYGTPEPFRRDVVEAYIPYAEQQLAQGVRFGCLVRPLMGLYAGLPGARRWRHRLGEGASRAGAGADVLRTALAALPRAA